MAIPTPKAAISTAMRAPYTTRLNISRPRESVPKRWVALGGCKGASAPTRSGGYRVMTGASRAVRSSKVVITPPTHRLGVRRRRICAGERGSTQEGIFDRGARESFFMIAPAPLLPCSPAVFSSALLFESCIVSAPLLKCLMGHTRVKPGVDQVHHKVDDEIHSRHRQRRP